MTPGSRGRVLGSEARGGVEGRLTVSRIPLAVCTVSVTEIAIAVEANGNNNDWRFENVHEISNIPFT